MKRYVLFLKIGLLVGLSLSIAFLLLKELYFTAVMCFIILLGTAFSLYQDQRKMLQKMEHLIANIHYGDMNLSFPIPSTDGPEANLTRAMNEALSAFRTRLYNVVVAEAETEAWQKLIRVLTHEIMNSIAPIISLSETVTLTTIPRASTATTSGSTMGKPLTITIKRASSSFKHKLYYTCGSVKDQLIAENVGTSYSWNAPPVSLAQQTQRLWRSRAQSRRTTAAPMLGRGQRLLSLPCRQPWFRPCLLQSAIQQECTTPMADMFSYVARSM